MKILVIDDDASIRNCIRHYLERKGYTVYEYDRAEGAVDYALKMRPDLVLTDHNLELRAPKGLEIAGELQREGQKVILMSSDPTVGGYAELAGVPFVEKADIKGVIAAVEVSMEPDGPGEEDGPWAKGWAERSGGSKGVDHE